MQDYRGRIRKVGYVLIASLLVTLIQAQERYVLDLASSAVTVNGGSTLKDWSVSVEDMEGWCTMNSDSMPGIADAVFSFVSKSFESGRGADMNAKIYKALDVTNHEAITFQAKTNTITSAPDAAEMEVNSTGMLSIAGETQEITITLTGTAEPLVLQGSYALKFSEYKIKPPSALFGQIVCDDEMDIVFDLHFKADNE